MSKTALIDALKSFDLPRVRSLLEAEPELERLQLDKGFNLLQVCCNRSTAGDPTAAARQLRLAKWLVDFGFDPRVVHTTAPGEDGEEEPATLSLVWARRLFTWPSTCSIAAPTASHSWPGRD